MKFLFVIMAFVVIFFVLHNKHNVLKWRILIITNQYVANMYAYLKLKDELLLQLQDKEKDIARVNELQNELEQLHNAIAKTQADNKGPEHWNLTDAILSDIIVRKLHTKGLRGEVACDEEWQQLHQSMNKYLPDFFPSLAKLGYHPNLRETNICILVRLRFMPSEIGSLLGLGPANVSKIRAELAQKMFHLPKSAKHFDDAIHMLNC